MIYVRAVGLCRIEEEETQNTYVDLLGSLTRMQIGLKKNCRQLSVPSHRFSVYKAWYQCYLRGCKPHAYTEIHLIFSSICRILI